MMHRRGEVQEGKDAWLCGGFIGENCDGGHGGLVDLGRLTPLICESPARSSLVRSKQTRSSASICILRPPPSALRPPLPPPPRVPPPPLSPCLSKALANLSKKQFKVDSHGFISLFVSSISGCEEAACQSRFIVFQARSVSLVSSRVKPYTPHPWSPKAGSFPRN